jgi:hypothetical protein
VCLWLGENNDIFYGKTITSNILTGYGPTPSSRQYNRWKVKWQFFVKLIVAPVAATTNPNPTLWAP